MEHLREEEACEEEELDSVHVTFTMPARHPREDV